MPSVFPSERRRKRGSLSSCEKVSKYSSVQPGKTTQRTTPITHTSRGIPVRVVKRVATTASFPLDHECVKQEVKEQLPQEAASTGFPTSAEMKREYALLWEPISIQA